MRILRPLMALCLAIMLLYTSALAEVPFLRYTKDWQLDTTPLDVYLTADVTTRMPYDEDRFDMLKEITNELSLRLKTNGLDEGSVTIAVGSSNLLTMAYQGQEVHLSSMPGAAFTAADDPMGKLLGSPVETGFSIYGVDGRGETLLNDGWVLLNELIPELEAYGTRKKNSTKIENMGTAAFRLDATISSSKAEELKPLLLSLCPDGWLKEIINSLTFSGKQTFRIYQTAKDVPLRMEYNGTCGPEGDARTVQLIWRMRRDDTAHRDEITLKSPAKSGNNRNTLSFDRIVKTSSRGVTTMEGSFSYDVRLNKQLTELEGEFDLKNAATKTADVISGSFTIKQKLPEASKFSAMTLEPELTFSGTQEEPSVSGSVTVTGKLGTGVTEQAKIIMTANRAEESEWVPAAAVIDLDRLNNDELASVQQQVAASVTNALIRPLIIFLGEENGDWFFRDLPKEAVQEILDAANSVLTYE